MPKLARRMTLTPELVSRVHRAVEDSGPSQAVVYHSEEDYDAAVRSALSFHSEGDDLWLFAFGSLIWKPEFVHVEERVGTAHGWHRSFCIKIVRWRGTRDQPGLMMALDRGGQCQGMLYRIESHTVESQVGKLFRREFFAKPPINMPHWLTVKTDQGSVRALGFVINRKAGEKIGAYLGGLSDEQVADTLSAACGHLGSGAEYLYNTVSHLEERGIHDSNLWRLQRLVAERISGSAEHPISN